MTKRKTTAHPSAKYDPFTIAEIDLRLKFLPVAREIMERYFYVYAKRLVGVPGKRGPWYGEDYEGAQKADPNFVDLRTEELLDMMLALDQAGYDIIPKGTYRLLQDMRPKLRTVQVHRQQPPGAGVTVPVTQTAPQYRTRRVLNRQRRVVDGYTVGDAIRSAGGGVFTGNDGGSDPGSAAGSDPGERLEDLPELPGAVSPEDAGQLPTADGAGSDSTGDEQGSLDGDRGPGLVDVDHDGDSGPGNSSDTPGSVA